MDNADEGEQREECLENLHREYVDAMKMVGAWEMKPSNVTVCTRHSVTESGGDME
jgi:hypothetical protein